MSDATPDKAVTQASPAPTPDRAPGIPGTSETPRSHDQSASVFALLGTEEERELLGEFHRHAEELRRVESPFAEAKMRVQQQPEMSMSFIVSELNAARSRHLGGEPRTPATRERLGATTSQRPQERDGPRTQGNEAVPTATTPRPESFENAEREITQLQALAEVPPLVFRLEFYSQQPSMVGGMRAEPEEQARVEAVERRRRTEEPATMAWRRDFALAAGRAIAGLEGLGVPDAGGLAGRLRNCVLSFENSIEHSVRVPEPGRMLGNPLAPTPIPPVALSDLLNQVAHVRRRIVELRGPAPAPAAIHDLYGISSPVVEAIQSVINRASAEGKPLWNFAMDLAQSVAIASGQMTPTDFGAEGALDRAAGITLAIVATIKGGAAATFMKTSCETALKEYSERLHAQWKDTMATLARQHSTAPEDVARAEQAASEFARGTAGSGHVAPASRSLPAAASRRDHAEKPRRGHDELVVLATAALKKHPGITLPQVAAAIGIDRRTIYKESWRSFRETRDAMLALALSGQPRGYREGQSGSVDAFDDPRARRTSKRERPKHMD